MESSANKRHQELLALLEKHDSEHSGSVTGSLKNDSSSSSLISLLPPQPKIFHGRQKELEDVVHALLLSPARVAILGGGGIGKTTLAAAVLHHPDIVSQYWHRHFISCESATTSVLLISTVALHLGLEPSRQPINMVVQHLSQCGSVLLVLDNLETSWEDIQTRIDVEELLARLSSVQQLALVITMRGSVRPGRVKWSRPFLTPLKPLHPTASRQIFVDISDSPSTEQEAAFSEIVEFTGHLPLAVSLMASITASEGYSNALHRLKMENTLLLSEGYKKESNLDMSIVLSLTSPRITSSPGAQELLSLLSILPDGLAEVECTAQNVPIPQILQCKSVLLRTSLAYIDSDRRLKALSPIREYIRREYPPHKSLVDPLGTYWQDLLSLWDSHQQVPGTDMAHLLGENIGNIDSLIRYQLQ
ncbi:P-loop containing nucleoside triphosphate hydrolase protein, partial [Mycena vulgaris]